MKFLRSNKDISWYTFTFSSIIINEKKKELCRIGAIALDFYKKGD